MNFYEKILISTYSSFARTNKINPIWSAVSGLSILHALNVFTIGLLMGYSIGRINRAMFMAAGTVLYGILIWVHYQKYMKGQSFSKKSRKLDSKSKFWYGLFSMIYGLITFGLFFWTLNTSWTPFIFLCLIFIGVSLSGYLFESKN